ncbi:PrsW family intramembrane metalloprotease [Arthrobacter crusticola]|uniref:PrsW family intramembrane metalloprotease n=1 Tax=Arthrobacter crusticola TaxID=2547960 RepID=A0A4R5U2I3_9MICC|nr:PrsW family intramembrane metalloprotease [Arthrobacter crusticola]TDK27869.1 PrsW family intramembrane metalloprotease [Arthrobacter crusticola]
MSLYDPSGSARPGHQGLSWWEASTQRSAPPAPQWNGLAPPPPVWDRPVKRGAGALNVVLLLVTALVLAALVWFLSQSLGTTALVLCAVLALVPLGICALGIGWIDRWDPEPRGALLFAFLWGAGISVVVTLLLGNYVLGLLSVALDSTSTDVIGPVLQAPVVEEFAKGLGVLILVYSRRSHFDGPVDGIVYAGTIAAGFAFTENILYFSSAILESGTLGAVVGVFVLRGLFSPFAHVMFTAALGFVVGRAVSRGGGPARVLPAFLLGLVPAIAGHMLWNGGTVLLFDDFFSFYLLVQVPLFCVAIVAVVLIRRAERRLTESRLGDYVDAGWFTSQEVSMLATGPGRAQALAWAGSFGARSEMKAFIRAATRLAFARQQMVNGRPRTAQAAEERALLDSATHHRSRLFALASARP